MLSDKKVFEEDKSFIQKLDASIMSPVIESDREVSQNNKHCKLLLPSEHLNS